MFSAALPPVRASRASQSSQTPEIRPYLLRFITHDGTRSVVAFANRDERDERGAQLLALGASITLATARVQYERPGDPGWQAACSGAERRRTAGIEDSERLL
jgi:hypothetical protein